MNELLSPDEGLDAAIERTRQHYWGVHADIRVDCMRVFHEIERLTSEIALASLDIPQQDPEKRPPPSKQIKEIYHRICRLCHPDKSGVTDPVLVEFMQDAKELYREGSSVIETLYVNLRAYLNNPEAYTKAKTLAMNQQRAANDPWYEVHQHFIKGEGSQAYMKSRRLLGLHLIGLKGQRDSLKNKLNTKDML